MVLKVNVKVNGVSHAEIYFCLHVKHVGVELRTLLDLWWRWRKLLINPRTLDLASPRQHELINWEVMRSICHCQGNTWDWTQSVVVCLFPSSIICSFLSALFCAVSIPTCSISHVLLFWHSPDEHVSVSLLSYLSVTGFDRFSFYYCCIERAEGTSVQLL